MMQENLTLTLMLVSLGSPVAAAAAAFAVVRAQVQDLRTEHATLNAKLESYVSKEYLELKLDGLRIQLGAVAEQVRVMNEQTRAMNDKLDRVLQQK